MGRKINYYLAVFIDVLGQGEKLKEIKNLPKNDDEAKKFNQLFKETMGAVQEVHDSFDSFFNSFNSTNLEKPIDFDNWHKDEQKIYIESKKNNLKYLKFSDTIVVYFPLDRESTKVPINSVFIALASAASTFLINLSSKIPLRGAIDIGIGTELKEGGLYGPILQNLHYLESEISQYPRIVIGDGLINMLNNYEKEDNHQNNQFLKIEKAMLPTIKNFISIDEDGVNILNYLDESMAKGFSTNMKQELYRKLNNFISGEINKCINNKKLLDRYKKMQLYVNKNKKYWI